MSTPTSPLEQLAGNQPASSAGSGSPLEQLLQSNTPPSTQQPEPTTIMGKLSGDPNYNLGERLHEFASNTEQAGIGAAKTLAKGAGVVGDIATLGLTHLLPGSENASAGINAPGKALEPTNDNQKGGAYIGDLASFELGSGLFNSLGHLPLAERVLQSAKALKVLQEHPVLTKIVGTALKGAGEGGAGTLVATGDPKTAVEGAAVGGVVAPAAEAVGKGIQFVRDIYKPLETAEAVQPVLQDAIRDVASQTAKDAGVEAPASTSIRDTVTDLADNVKAKSQPVFQKIDELSNGAFSDAQADANRYRGSIDKAGKDAYAEALQNQEKVFDSVKGQMDPDALNKARADWKQYNALNEVSDALQNSTSGSRPEIAAASKAAQPPETVNPKQLMGKLNKLYNEGTLQTAFGSNAHTLLDHAGAAQAKLVNIADAITAQNSKKRAVNYVVKKAVGTAIGGGVLAEGAKLAGVLGGKK